MYDKTKTAQGIKKLAAAEEEIRGGKRLYSLKEAGVYLGRSVNSMRELVWAKLLPVVSHGRKMWVDVADLNDYITRHKSPA